MIYTQSIYLEGMEQFFPKIFQTIVDKSILEKDTDLFIHHLVGVWTTESFFPQ